MRVLDSLIVPYLEVYTDVAADTVEEIKEKLKKGMSPMEAKMFFAGALVRRYHGEQVAEETKRQFIKLFSKKEINEHVPEVALEYKKWGLVDLIIALNKTLSRSEIRRLIIQGAIEIEGRVENNNKKIIPIKKGVVIKIGKKNFYRIK